MSDTRKNVKVSSNVKSRLEEVKRMIGCKTESEAIAFMILTNTWAMEKMPTNVYREALAKYRELDRQESI